MSDKELELIGEFRYPFYEDELDVLMEFLTDFEDAIEDFEEKHPNLNIDIRMEIADSNVDYNDETSGQFYAVVTITPKNVKVK